MKPCCASISYGKDSLAMLHVIRDVLDWPLDRIVTADEMATDDLPADLPPMAAFKQYADQEIEKRFGIQVEHYLSRRRNGQVITFESLFYRRRGKHSKNQGEIVGWPTMFGRYCNSKLKLQALKQMEKHTAGCIHYIGIAADEPKRIIKHERKENVRMPLVEAGWTEEMCRGWCEQNGLLAPNYAFSRRSGCFFCPYQPLDQLRMMRRDYPELWALMLKWDGDSPVPFKAQHHKGDRGTTLLELDARFDMEERQTDFLNFTCKDGAGNEQSTRSG